MAQYPRFSLVVVASCDGFIARAAGHSPADWQSPEEQAFFLGTVAGADWCVLGRTTHQTAFRLDRRRVVFSHSAPLPEWRSPLHLWLDPTAFHRTECNSRPIQSCAITVMPHRTP